VYAAIKEGKFKNLLIILLAVTVLPFENWEKLFQIQNSALVRVK